MDVSHTLVNLGTVLLLVALNGYFVAAEFSLVSMRTTRIDQLADDGHAMASFLQRAKADPSRFLSASQTGITLASLALGWLGEPTVAELVLAAFQALGVPTALVAVHTIATVVTFILITYTHIVLGELVPKALALQRTEPTLLLTAWPMRYLTVAFTPFIVVLQRSTQWLLGRIGISAVPEHHLVYSEEELKRIVDASHEVGVLEANEQAMLHKVFAFSDRVAREIMVPRPDVRMVAVDTGFFDLLRAVREEGHTRFPVYEDSADNVLGVFNAKDLFAYLDEAGPGRLEAEAFDLRKLIREVPFVPENKPVDDLMAEMRKSRAQMAIVMDEFGGTAGLVTLEDIIEEIVGDISDEFDEIETEEDLQQLGPHHYKVGGRYRIADFNDRFNSELPTSDFNTMAGLIFGTLGRDPQPGDQVVIGAYRFAVYAMEGHRITWLEVHLQPHESGDAPLPPDEA